MEEGPGSFVLKGGSAMSSDPPVATAAEGGATVVKVWTGPATRQGFLPKLGRKTWPLLHSVADRWLCRRCRPSFSVWMQGVHDSVNVRIGKKPFRPESWAKFTRGALEGSYHRGCFVCRVVRRGVRLIARAPRSPAS